MKRYSLIKKVITTMSAAVLVFSCGMTAFAAEANLNTDGEQKDIGVYVKYVDNTVWNTVPTDENGEGSTTLPDGTEVGISDADKTQGQLVIDPITDKEALDWINSVTDGKVKAPQAFHIYYEYFMLRKALNRTKESTISLHGKHQRATRKWSDVNKVDRKKLRTR